jgi:hypothetical protein
MLTKTVLGEGSRGAYATQGASSSRLAKDSSQNLLDEQSISRLAVTRIALPQEERKELKTKVTSNSITVGSATLNALAGQLAPQQFLLPKEPPEQPPQIAPP